VCFPSVAADSRSFSFCLHKEGYAKKIGVAKFGLHFFRSIALCAKKCKTESDARLKNIFVRSH